MTFLYFCVGLFFTLTVPTLFPSLKVFFLIPCLIRAFYEKPRSFCLWLAFFSGFILDLFSAHARFGLLSATYVAATYTLYGMKRHFFEDSFTTLPVLTYIFSMVATAIHLMLILILDKQSLIVTPYFLLVDFFWLPLYDALFALCIFSIPKALFGKPIRKGSDYFT